MVDLLDQHFEGISNGVFESDLANKTHAVLVRDHDDRLAGFSTFAIYTAGGPDGEPTTIVCSGDTIVASDARRSSLLPSAWVQAVHALHRQTGNTDLYWLLITSGYRTYRFLPVFVKTYYPGVEQPGDADLVAWMHQLATERWGRQYNAESGIVSLDHAQPLQRSVSEVPMGRLTDPHIAFFLDRNPGHVRGDELVSLAKLNKSNLTSAGLRMLLGKAASMPVQGVFG
ncbi:MAG: hypothetical protein AAGI37_03955 [Planctomycetota bacterium]